MSEYWGVRIVGLKLYEYWSVGIIDLKLYEYWGVGGIVDLKLYEYWGVWNRISMVGIVGYWNFEMLEYWAPNLLDTCRYIKM